MIKNAKSLMDKSRNLAQKCNITTNEVLQNYMFERILERLSISKYKNNFILKGGLLLSSIMGIDIRTTMDMDTCIKGISLTDDELYQVLNEILSIDVGDNVKFEIKKIINNNEYTGLPEYIVKDAINILTENHSIAGIISDFISINVVPFDGFTLSGENIIAIINNYIY